jgi:hypothetical protein
MTKLRVGDIEIDGRNVLIRDQSATVPSVLSGKRAIDHGAVRFLRRFPLRPSTLWKVGATGVMLGGALVFVGMTGTIQPLLLLVGGGLLSVGVGLIGAGVLKRQLQLRPELEHRAALGVDADHYLRQVSSILGKVDRRQTVGWIMRKTDLDEEAVVRSLAILIARSVVSEQFDVEQQEYYYVVTAAYLPRDIDSRLRTLTS